VAAYRVKREVYRRYQCCCEYCSAEIGKVSILLPKMIVLKENDEFTLAGVILRWKKLWTPARPTQIAFVLTTYKCTISDFQSLLS